MRKTVVFLNSALAAGVAVLIMAAMTVLFLMFTTPQAGVKKTGLFGGVFFESVERPDGAITVGGGVESWVPLAVIWVVLALLVFLTVTTYRGLVAYKNSLTPAGQRT